MTQSAQEPAVEETPSAASKEEFKPQRSSRLVDWLVGAVLLLVVLGGIGKAFSDSDLFAPAPQSSSAVPAEGCPEGGCMKPPDDLCGDHPVKAVVLSDGRRVYYTGDRNDYVGVIAMHIERGDRWFCTAAAAEENGFVIAP